jgi:16S rRNA G966 N2-methylase RsmD
MNKTDLIQKVKALEGLSQDERAYLINLVNIKKKYGLVWEDKPEEVEEQLRENLPVLKEVKDKAIINGGVSLSGAEVPNHILIEGDNLHALTALTFTHEGKIDVIYIDPPYNTGNKDFKYNDSFVDKEDSYRHSKWLSFMNKRLKIAKKLLKDSGVIFISIDDNEIAQLKMLCNEIFLENNMIAEMVWQQGKKSSGNLIGVNHEYMLVYANNRSLIDNPNNSWKQKKDGLEKIYKKFDGLKKEFRSDYNKIEKEIKAWFNSLAENDPAYSSKHYSLVDENGLFFADNSCAPDRPETRCHKPLIHPITKKETAVPSLGWRWKEDTLDKMVLDCSR